MSSHGPPRELWVPDTGCLEEVQSLLRSLGSAGVESLRLFDLRRVCGPIGREMRRPCLWGGCLDGILCWHLLVCNEQRPVTTRVPGWREERASGASPPQFNTGRCGHCSELPELAPGPALLQGGPEPSSFPWLERGESIQRKWGEDH